MADKHGNIVHLGERDCSIQRRNQKVIEECPSPLLTPGAAQEDGAGCGEARAVGRLRGCRHDGVPGRSTRATIYFMEMNTRIQVEHTITEEVYGCDLVKEQIQDRRGRAAVAARRPTAAPRSHAIQCRINAEDPAQQFPALGRADRALLRARRARRADRFARLYWLHRAALLRLDDCEADRGRGDARIGHRTDAARARANISLPASRRRFRFTARSCATPTFATATTTPASSTG